MAVEHIGLKLPAAHSDMQRQLITSKTTDVCFGGRRWGKTHVGVSRIAIASNERPGMYWWVGLGWKSASLKRAWRMLKQFARAAWSAAGEAKPDLHIRESVKELSLPWGSEIWMRTAERPDSLAGEGIMGCVLDEFTLMDEKVWSEYVEATLLDKSGWALFIGVPKGKNWGYDLWSGASTRPGWRQWHTPTRTNPLLPMDKLEEIRLHTPSGLFRQEYEAEVVDNAGLAFVNIEKWSTEEQLDEPAEGSTYTMGIDWGKKDDYTVVTCFDSATHYMVDMMRINGDDYPTQLNAVRAFAEKWAPRCIVAETNAMGEPLCDQLIVDGLPIRKLYLTNSSKEEIIQALQVAFEQGYIRLLRRDVAKALCKGQDALQGELDKFEVGFTAQGKLKFGAPPGKHDDCVMSVALAYSELRYDIGVSF